MKNKIWLSSPHMGGAEQKYIKEAFDTNWIAPLGPNVDGFENTLAHYVGAEHCAALVSGTAAIHLALILSDVKEGDEVLCQSFTFSATANPIVYQKAIPVFVDSEAETWNMDPSLLEKAIVDRMANGKKPKACIVVHLYGMPAKMKEIKMICEKYDIILIEDAAEALGSEIEGAKVGSFGDFGVFSFNGNKIITTSGGGALVSNDKEKIVMARFLATQARDPAPHYQHSHIGYNYRMSNIAAGIGRGQMEVLDQWVKNRRENYRFYKENLSYEFQEGIGGLESNRWLSAIITGSFEEREELRLRMESEDIECRPLWKPMHLQPVFENYPSYLNGISENLFKKGLCLPSGSNLIDSDLERIVKLLNLKSI
ncbi:MAG: DegT/DnrJ/EryC1/StrS family aminotransferase [Cytophagaceae bacterium]|nr:DegT/DnrJ/EryC1/StrS family aminotransferase [Cytophagaceae bacterium]